MWETAGIFQSCFFFPDSTLRGICQRSVNTDVTSRLKTQEISEQKYLHEAIKGREQ